MDWTVIFLEPIALAMFLLLSAFGVKIVRMQMIDSVIIDMLQTEDGGPSERYY